MRNISEVDGCHQQGSLHNLQLAGRNKGQRSNATFTRFICLIPQHRLCSDTVHREQTQRPVVDKVYRRRLIGECASVCTSVCIRV